MKLGLREIFFVLLLLAMPVVAYFVNFKKNNEDIAQARQEIVVKRQKLAQLEAATMNVKDLGQEIEKLAEAIELFEQKLPSERETEVILREVWELATRHNLASRSFKTDKVINEPSYSIQPISMSIYGNFDSFYSFLIDLEKLPRLTQIWQMNIQRMEKDGEGYMKADIVLRIFFERKSSQTTPAATTSGKAKL